MIETRHADAGDAEAIAALHAKSWREHYRGAFTDAYLDGDLPGERLRVWRGRLAEARDDQLVLLATEDAALVGFVCVHAARDADWGSFVDNLHVASAQKRRGIGATLMRSAGAWLCARGHGALGVHLLVLEENASARRFYERLGARNAETREMETHGGAWVRSCRYVWARAEQLAAAAPAEQP